ncbi:MAG: adenylate/guanylate cyclase domain-containing protein [Ginsengibacter sp.]
MKTLATSLLVLFLFFSKSSFSNSIEEKSKFSFTEDDSTKIFKLLADANIYASQRDYEKAVASALLAASISEKDGFEYGKYRSYLVLEILYREAGKLFVSAKYKLRAMNSQSRLEQINYERDERERIEKNEKERKIREQQKLLEKEQDELKLKMDEIEKLERENKLSKNELDKRKYEIAKRQLEIASKKETIDIQRETINSTFNQLSLTMEELEAQRLHAKIFDDSLKLAKRNEEVFVISQEKQKLINYLYILGLSGFTILAAFIYRMYTVKSRIQNLLESKNMEVESERGKIDGVLLNLLPLKVADELKQTGKYEPRYFEKTAILLINLSCKGKLNEFLNQSKYVEELNLIYQTFDEISERNNLERIRAFGIQYLCISGIPNQADYNPMNIIRAAIEMKNFIFKRGLEMKAKNNNYFEIIAIINTGSLLSGMIGTKLTYDVWGETILIASEIQNFETEGKVIITDIAYNETKEKIECELLGKFPVRNHNEMNLFILNKIIDN